MLMTITDWINSTFSPNSRPHYNTVLKWINTGLIAADRIQHIGRNVFIKSDTQPPVVDANVKRIAEKL